MVNSFNEFDVGTFVYAFSPTHVAFFPVPIILGWVPAAP